MDRASGIPLILNQGLEFTALPEGHSCGCGWYAGGLRVPSSEATRTEAVLAGQPLIAVIDDDDSFRDSMRRLLKALGYTASVFASAAEFLASPQLTMTACVVADIQMPAMTGIELFVHLLKIGRPIPTILVTAYPNDGVQQRVLSLGVKCYLRKPLREADLIGCLVCACDRPRRGEPSSQDVSLPK